MQTIDVPRAGGVRAVDSPTAPSDRIVTIDIVRGVALFGVMAINVTTAFRVSIFEQFLPIRPDATWLDRVLNAILMIGIDLKAFALFSLLFGMGLAIQYDHLSAAPRRVALLVRRLAFLALVGAIHFVLIWNGDILLEYALAGFIVLPFLFAPTRMLGAAGMVLLLVYVAMPLLPPIASLPSRIWMTQHVAEAARIYGSGDFAAVLTFRVRELPAILPLHVLVFPRTVALMLIGAWLWRAGLFRAKAGGAWYSSWYSPWAAAVGVIGGGALAISLTNGWLSFNRTVSFSLERFDIGLLACGYGAAIIWATSKVSDRRLLAWAAPIGRMAFTNYLMQSLIFGWLFYGYGLGLFGKLDVAAALGIGTAIYALQVAFSAFWLRRYAFGPLEWLWRAAMYGTWQPVRRGQRPDRSE